MVINENRKAIIWSGIDKVGSYIVNFSIQIVLARLLCPDDYAVVAMLSIFFAISQAFIDCGFATALIQKQDCSQADYSSVFFFNIFISGVIYMLFFLGAPFIESFYGFKGLSIVTKFYSLNLFINSFAMVHRVILTKNLQFKTIAKTTFVSSIISAIIAVIMAYYGLGYWALVGQSLMSAVVTSCMLIYQSKWKPSMTFSINSLSNLAPLGLSMLVISLFHAVYNNIYALLIGKYFTAVELGYYDRSKTLSSMGPVGFSDFYTRALYPIQAKIQHDVDVLGSSYKKSFFVICMVVVPIAAFMFFFADEVVYTILGSQWMNCSFILKILCLGYMFYPLQALNMNMLKVKGRGDYMLFAEVIKKVMGIVCVLILINFNLRWVVIGWTCCAIAEFFVSECILFKVVRFSFYEHFRIFITIAFTTFFLSFALFYVASLFFDNLTIRFVVGGGGFVFAFLLINYKKIKKLLNGGRF